MMKNIFNIMSAASFAGVLFMILMITYVNITKASREERKNSISKVLLRRQS